MRNEPLIPAIPADAPSAVPPLESLAIHRLPSTTTEPPFDLDRSSREIPSPSILEKFISGFFQETNIKWMLMIGAAIVTVCSLKLVAQQWHDWSVTFKYLAILLYVGAVAGFAHASDRMLGLRSTSTVLRVLTLLLIPISFFSLGWLTLKSGEGIWAWGPLLGLGTAMGWFLSDSIFRKLFLGRQWTFQLSYLALAMAGSMPVLSSDSLWFASVIWLVGTAGIIKANRHFYWLTVEHRKPTIFAFFPTLLLGTQMALLFASKLSWIGHWEWLGFGFVLCALPMAATTRSIAMVHRAKTGGLLQVLPIHVIVPLLFSLSLCAAGVILSFHGFRWGGSSTYAVVPTAAIAAGMAWFAAYDTRHRAFTWIAIVLSLIAYQCAPSLVSDLAKSVVQSTAASLSESRLPIAFYGVTYLPALLLLSLGSGWIARRKSSTDSRYLVGPMQHAATALSLLLLVLSISHFKACFLIPVVHAVLFAVYAFVWRDRRYLIVSLGAVGLATGAWIPFANAMWGMHLSLDFVATSLGTLGCALVILPIDRLIAVLPIPACKPLRISEVPSGRSVPIATVMGGTIAGSVALYWCATRLILWKEPLDAAAWLTFGVCLLSSLGLLHRTRHYLLGGVNALLLLFFAAVFLSSIIVGPLHFVAVYTTLLTMVSMVGYSSILFTCRTRGSEKEFAWSAVRRSLGLDLESLSFRNNAPSMGRSSLLNSMMLPLADIATLGVVGSMVIHSIGIAEAALLFHYEHLVWSMGAIGLWIVFAIAVTRSKVATAFSIGLLPVLVAIALQWSGCFPHDHRASVLIWTTTALVAGVVPVGIERRLLGSNAIGQTNNHNASAQLLTSLVPPVVSVWFFGAMAVSLFPFSSALQVAGLIALAGIWILHAHRLSRVAFTSGMMLANALLYLLLLPLLDPQWMRSSLWNLGNFAQFAWQDTLTTSAGILFGLVIANLWGVRRFFDRLHRELGEVWLLTMMALAGSMFVACFVQPKLSILSILGIGYGLGHVLHSLVQFARTTGRERYVWASFAVLVATGSLLVTRGWAIPSYGVALFLIALLGIALESFGRWITKAPEVGNWRVFGRPLLIVGVLLPIAISVVGAAAIVVHPSPKVMQWLAFASLVSGFASCMRALSNPNRFYAWQTMVMWNVAIALMSRSMGWSDIQFYLVPIGLSIIGLVEIMKQQIPSGSHKPLRLVGSLIVLVSPVFEIVDGSWLHMFCLMVLSVTMVMMAIGLRVRVLMFTGVSFLAADLIAMLVRSAIDRPSLLWVCGLGLGLGVIGIAALCEIYRERLLSKVRMLTAELAQWS